MNTHIIDNGTHNRVELERLLASYNPTTHVYNELTVEALKPDDFVVLSGGSQFTANWHDSILENELEIIRKHEGPIIGICFGMQLIAHAFGASLHLLPERRRGLAPLTPINNEEIFQGIDYPQVFESHNWSVQKLPPELVALAQSGAGVEMLKHVKRPLYGMQFHPEVSKPGDGTAIFKNVLKTLSR